MAYGRLSNPKNAAARVYSILRARRGQWVTGWDLTINARTTAIGTRISEIRQQLPADERIELVRKDGVKYRLVRM